MHLQKIIFSCFGHAALLATLLASAYAQEDRGFVGGGGYFVYQCSSFEESVSRLSLQGRQDLWDMCREDTDVEDCVHEFFNLPSGCKMEVSVQSFEEKIHSNENLLQLRRPLNTLPKRYMQNIEDWRESWNFPPKEMMYNVQDFEVFERRLRRCMREENASAASCVERLTGEEK